MPLASECKQAVPPDLVAVDHFRGILDDHADSFRFAELDLGLVHLGHIELQLCHMAVIPVAFWVPVGRQCLVGELLRDDFIIA